MRLAEVRSFGRNERRKKTLKPSKAVNLYFALIGFFNSLVAALTGLYIFLQNRASPLYRSYFLFTMSVALWSGFYGIWQIQSAEGPALFFMRLTMIPCYAIPFAFLWFVLNLTEDSRKKSYVPFCLVLPAFFIAFGFSEFNVKDVTQKLFFPFWPIPGPLMHVYVVLYCLAFVFNFTLLFRALIHSSGAGKRQLQWITYTLLAAWACGSTNWFLWYDIPVPPAPNAFVAVIFLLLAYAVIRGRLFEIDALMDMVQEAKLSALGTLAAGINHEIRNPLYIVKSLAETFLDEKREGALDQIPAEARDERAARVMKKTVEQIDRALEIAKRLSEFARPRIGAPVRERVPLRKAADDALAFMKHELEADRVKVEMKVAPDSSLFGDRKQIEEIFLNLMLNACQAMPHGGILTIEEESGEDGIRIHISDTGEGISRERMKRIFDPFYTTKGERGTGLGLYITKQLIERNHGKISVHSQEGKGTAFTIEFSRSAV